MRALAYLLLSLEVAHDLAEKRDAVQRLPFQFGAVTLNRQGQPFARVS
jgi:hypothetical protein